MSSDRGYYLNRFPLQDEALCQSMDFNAMTEWLFCLARKVLYSNLSAARHGMILDKALTAGYLR